MNGQLPAGSVGLAALSYLISANFGALAAVVGHRHEQSIALGHEKAGARSGCGRNFRDWFVMVRIGLLNDVDVTRSANHIEASPPGVVENFIGVAGNVDAGHSRSRVGVENDELRGIPARDKQPVVRFVEGQRKVC
jgi:hypothetical protein